MNEPVLRCWTCHQKLRKDGKPVSPCEVLDCPRYDADLDPGAAHEP